MFMLQDGQVEYSTMTKEMDEEVKPNSCSKLYIKCHACLLLLKMNNVKIKSK
jgi:hypothetical protein